MVELFAVLEFAALCGAAWYIIRLRREVKIGVVHEDKSSENLRKFQLAVEALWYRLFGPSGTGGPVSSFYNDLWRLAGLEEKGSPK